MYTISCIICVLSISEKSSQTWIQCEERQEQWWTKVLVRFRFVYFHETWIFKELFYSTLQRSMKFDRIKNLEAKYCNSDLLYFTIQHFRLSVSCFLILHTIHSYMRELFSMWKLFKKVSLQKFHDIIIARLLLICYIISTFIHLY